MVQQYTLSMLSSSPKRSEGATLTNVGSYGDHGMKAVAAALLDQCFIHPWLNRELLRLITARHAMYYPASNISFDRNKTPAESLTQAIKKTSLHVLIAQLGETFEQIAVQELNASMVYLAHDIPQTSRKNHTRLAALANALQLPIQLQLIDQAHDLPLYIEYQREAENSVSNPLLRIQYCNHLYQPFLHVLKQHTKPRFEQKTIMGELASDTTGHQEQRNRLMSKLREHCDTLTRLTHQGHLNQSDLIQLYIRYMSTEIKANPSYIGTEHGLQSFFEDMAPHQHIVDPALEQPGNHSSALKQELIQALARAITVGQMDMHKVVEHIEQQETTHNKLAQT